MIYCALGILLVFAPFVGIFFYPNLKEGLLKITLYTALFHFIVSVLTQATHIFNYSIIVALNVFFITVLLGILYLKKEKKYFLSKKELFLKFKNNLMFLGVIGIIFLQLFFVHHSYTGIVQTIHGQQTVSSNTYVYPFFSDEWVTISEIQYTINNHALPLVNTLYHNVPFPNILFAFSSVLAELFLITGFNPLTHYWIFEIIFGLFLCISLYVLLKKYGISNFISAISILCVPYIVNSGNLPALWSLLPFTIGTIFLLWQIIAQESKFYRETILYSILGLIVYPPIIIFIFPVWLVELFSNRQKSSEDIKKKLLPYLIPFGTCLFVFVFIFYLTLAHFGITILEVWNKYIIRPNLDGGIVSYPIWNILPKIMLLFAIIGLSKIFKKKYLTLLLVLGIGLLYWCVYAFLNKVFIIEYPRVVFITSLFVIVLAGIGIEWLKEKIITLKQTNQSFIAIGTIIITISLLFLRSYPSDTSWKKLPLTINNKNGGQRVFIPASPANRYLTNDDLKLFKDIHNANFIAPAWKGLAISVATGNFSLETKPSTITNSIFPYYKFMNLDCAGKEEAVNQNNISYVYSDQFSCPDFELNGTSSENLYLYKFNKKSN